MKDRKNNFSFQKNFNNYKSFRHNNSLSPLENNNIFIDKTSFNFNDNPLNNHYKNKNKEPGNLKSNSLIKFPLINKKIKKSNSAKHIISINTKLINDLNNQIINFRHKMFCNIYNYKQTINLQQLNDYMIYESTRKKIENNENVGKRSPVDFRIPLIYRRIANHCKKEDLVPIKNKPKINLEEILILHNSIFRKNMNANKTQNFYLKQNLKLIQQHKNSKIIDDKGNTISKLMNNENK